LYFDKAENDKGLKQVMDLAGLPIWQGANKGTIHQYYSFFPNDKGLKTLSKIMKDNNNA